MNISTAQLPARSGDDRVLVAANGVVLLDGATAFDPDMPSASAYVDVLAEELNRRLDSSQDLRTILSDAIAATASVLRLQPGQAPSSTVSVLRTNQGTADLLVLGDSPVVVGRDGSHDLITDRRMAELNLPESERYRERLASGSGYDQHHYSLLRSLQRRQRERRNRPDGYWIAEADPSAADHAIVANYRLQEIDWIVLATDGASNPLRPLSISWAEVAQMDTPGLTRLLARCQEWEAEVDPCGQLQPRSKRHDDKSIVVAHAVGV
ncbi:PP2C family serine/threonine-protein phosphatase [Nocardia altamirensis]|uniref:PP2C family serine/threonine-protein phosphatase n=1 Tax=Nocardia altamirensis TaxID=472158 RepID=UPI000840478C|nr:PP2C family serine/threonine-protein phosphatase [Nocardia altamirensis]